MSVGKNFARVAELLRGGGVVFVVDVAGIVHPLHVAQYSALTAADLEGAQVFTQEDLAHAFAEKRRAGRN